MNDPIPEKPGFHALFSAALLLLSLIHIYKIALSLKFPEENPWLTAAEDFAVGNVVKGKVARMTDFGAFVDLAPGVDALLHVSQISREHVAKPSDVLSICLLYTSIDLISSFILCKYMHIAFPCCAYTYFQS